MTKKDPKSMTSKNRIGSIINCKKFNICQMQRSKLFMKEPFCDIKNSTTPNLNRYDLDKYCKKVPKSTIDKICQTKKITAVKAIRIRRLEDVAQLLREDENFYVIYLVRDPRALVNSRYNIPQNNWKLGSNGKNGPNDQTINLDQLNSVCQRYDANLRFYSHMRKENRNRVYILRYEDLNLDLVKYTVDIYRNFLGINDSGEILDVINGIKDLSGQERMDRKSLDDLLEKYPAPNRSSLKNDLDSSPDDFIEIPSDKNATLFQEYLKSKSRTKRGNFFNTARSDPSKSLSSWMKSMPWEAIQRIQEKCENSMKILGYKYYENEASIGDSYELLEKMI